MKHAKEILIFILTSFNILFTAELYFSTTGISLPSYVHDEKYLGRTHKPGQKIYEANAEGFCIDEVNEFGYTGNGYPKSKNSSVIRVGLFGSSYIEGLQVFRRNRFSTILENLLRQKLNKSIEILNFAIGGDDFRGMFFRYLKFASVYKTDLNLFFLQNQALTKQKTIPSPDVIIQNDSIVFSYEYLQAGETKLREKFQFIRLSAIGNLIKEGFEVYYSGRLPKIIFDKLYLESSSHNNHIQLKTDDFFDKNIKILNYLSEVNQDNYPQNIIVLMDSIDSNYLNHLSEKNIPIINLYDELKSYGHEKLHFWKASNKIGHWNNFAHRLVGYLLSKNLEEFLSNKNGFVTLYGKIKNE
ncbi:MAG: hypothetical protein N3A61_07165 [Ignavibacteria bacterium]|nr:hypothetical protein [Ignavibacteria bacterium]